MKKIFLLFLITIMSSLFSSAETMDCVADDGYNVCKGDLTSYKGVTVAPQIMINTENFGTYSNGYYIKQAGIKIKPLGDKAYWCENCINDWSEVKCSSSGCSGSGLQEIPTNQAGELIVADTNPSTYDETNSYQKCPVFIAWEYDKNSNGDWAWSWVGYGWLGDGQCFDLKTVNCENNNQCNAGTICDKSGDWTTWKCVIPPECSTGQTKCFGSNFNVCSNGKWSDSGLVKGKCDVECTKNSHCSQTYNQQPYCKGDNVYTQIKTGVCSNNECDSTSSEELIKTCDNGCSNGQCKDVPPLNCVEGTSQDCMVQGQIGTQTCQNNQWSTCIHISPTCDDGDKLTCTINDKEGEKVCSNNKWSECKATEFPLTLIFGLLSGLSILGVLIYLKTKKR